MSKPVTLNAKTLINARAQKPDYDRHTITPGIVHLGTGAFHRAHQAMYIDDLLASQPDWGIVGASLRNPATADALNAQDGLFTIRETGSAGIHHRIIGSISHVIAASGDSEPLLQQLADPAIRIVTLTVTEKGYCHDPASGQLDENHTDIVADLTTPKNPRSAPGILVEALRRRKTAGANPFTILSCDNLPENGKTTERVILAFARLRDPNLANWIEKNVTFPSTMVDRIVPAVTPDIINQTEASIGIRDSSPVATEPFSQWIMEGKFCAGRPDFEKAGVEMVEDVRPFEDMKLRILNGSHSAIAYLGYLAGLQTVAETITVPAFSHFIHDMISTEIIPTLDMPEGTDLSGYRDSLITRFQNPGLQHRTWQIAMDGSQKLPQRFLATIRDRLDAEAPFERLALGVAAWMFYASGIDEAGNEIDVRDPMAKQLREIGDQYRGDTEALSNAFINLPEIFDPALRQNKKFRSTVTDALNGLQENGALASLTKING